MDAKPVQLPELSAKAYGTWAERMRSVASSSSQRGRIPSIASGILDEIAAQASRVKGRGQRLAPTVAVPLEIVDGIVRQLQRLSALTPRKDASSDLEEVGWLIELALRKATRAPVPRAEPAQPADAEPARASEPPPAEEPISAEDPVPAEELEVVQAAVEELHVVQVVEPAPVQEPEVVQVVEPAPVQEPEVVQVDESMAQIQRLGPPAEEPKDEGPVEEPQVVQVDEVEPDEEQATSEDQSEMGDGAPEPEVEPVSVEPISAEDDEVPATAIEAAVQAPIRVLLVDDEPRTLAMLAVTLKGERDIEVVGLASDVSEAIAIARTTEPDVAVVDVRMPRGGGPRAARGILALSSATRILAYSALDERRAVLSMLEAGAVGYLVKGGPQEEVAAAIRRAMLGERPLSSELADEVMRALTERVRLEADDRESRDQLERQVRRFVSGRDLRMVWQPIVQLHSREVVGAEALPRFEGLSKRTPEGWFREAWRLGFGPELEGSVLEAAAGRLEQLPRELFIAVNLSPGCLVEPGFLDGLKHLPWERIVVEVTERSSVDDYAQLRAAAREIRRRGGRLAVDDAGAAFASLRHVAEIEPDLVKMDERVCRNIHMDPRMHALATALISFSRELGAEIVAEGIEHRGQLEVLKEIGVEFGQGPLFTGVADSKQVRARAAKRRRARR